MITPPLNILTPRTTLFNHPDTIMPLTHLIPPRWNASRMSAKNGLNGASLILVHMGLFTGHMATTLATKAAMAASVSAASLRMASRAPTASQYTPSLPKSWSVKGVTYVRTESRIFGVGPMPALSRAAQQAATCGSETNRGSVK